MKPNNHCDFSEDRRFRYTLWRVWDESKGYAQFIGLNPSTADETQDDPTVRRCIDYARRWGYGGLCMTNLFAYRATDPKEMKAYWRSLQRFEQDEMFLQNISRVMRVTEGAGVVVCAWGANEPTWGDAMRQNLEDGIPLHCLKLTKDGHPSHPLYLRKDLKPIPYGS